MKTDFIKYFRLFVFSLFCFGISLSVFAQSDTINQSDAQNRKQGYWEKKYGNGELRYQGYFKDNVPIGEMKRFYESGALQAILDYGNGESRVYARMFYEDGNPAAEGVYINMQKDSVWKYYSYYDHSVVLQETYKTGKRDGKMLYYYTNGAVSEEVSWVDGVKQGPWIQYYADGSVKLQATYQNGVLEGEFLSYQEGGIPYVKGTYLHDERHNLWIFYDEQGNVQIELNYKEGVCQDAEKIEQQQLEFFEMVDENKGKFSEPDETQFLMPSRR